MSNEPATLTTRQTDLGTELVLDCKHTQSVAFLINSQAAPGFTLEDYEAILITSRRLNAPCKCVEALALERKAGERRN